MKPFIMITSKHYISAWYYIQARTFPLKLLESFIIVSPIIFARNKNDITQMPSP